MHQYHSELPVTVKSGAILRRPVCRERWELSNDDVVLLEKIGRVSQAEKLASMNTNHLSLAGQLWGCV